MCPVTGAEAATQAFRRVDSDGDGEADAPQALTAAKAAGRVVRPFRSVDLDGDGVPDQPLALTAAKGVRKSITSPFKTKTHGRHASESTQRESDLAPGVAASEES